MKINEITIEYKPTETENDLYKITQPDNIVRILRENWDGINVQETVYIVYLNKANNIKGILKHTVGSIDSCIVDVKIILATALKSLSSSIIVAHNHPSGTLKASEADKKFTENLKKCCDLFNITLLDSLIITEDSYVSII